MTSQSARLRGLLVRLLACIGCLPALGQADILPSTPADFRQLPAYCAARLEKAGPEAFARWNEIIGPNFIHIHHYCFGLHKRRMAAREPDPAERKRLVRSAIGEITYVESHAQGDIPFYAEIFTVRGKLHLMLNEKAEAASYFKRAIARDPGFGPAYGALARMLRDEGRMDQARRVIAEGVRVAPNSPSLRKLMAQYGVAAAEGQSAEGATQGSGTTPQAGKETAAVSTSPVAGTETGPDKASVDKARPDASP